MISDLIKLSVCPESGAISTADAPPASASTGGPSQSENAYDYDYEYDYDCDCDYDAGMLKSPNRPLRLLRVTNDVLWCFVVFRDKQCSRPSNQRATPRTPQACCRPPGSTLMRPLVLDESRGSLTQLTFVWLALLVRVLENRCFTTHNTTRSHTATSDEGSSTVLARQWRFGE